MSTSLFAPRADPNVTTALTPLDNYAEPQAPMPMMTGLSAFDAYSPQPEPMVTFASEPMTPTVGALFAQGPSSPQATAANPVTQRPSLPRTDLPRFYTPPPPGSFDPYTAAMTGNIPQFFSYSDAPYATGSSADRGGADTVGGGDGDWTVPTPSTPSPDQSLSGLLNSLRTGLSVATGPFGIATALFSLALSDAAKRDPSFNLSTREKLRAIADVLGLSAPVPNARDTDDVVSDLPMANVDTGTTPTPPTPPAPSTLAPANAVIGTPTPPGPGALADLEVSPEAPKATSDSVSAPSAGALDNVPTLPVAPAIPAEPVIAAPPPVQETVAPAPTAPVGALDALVQQDAGAGAVDTAPTSTPEAPAAPAPDAPVGSLDALSEPTTEAPAEAPAEAPSEATNVTAEAGKAGSEEGGQKAESGGQKGSPGPASAAAPAAAPAYSAAAQALAEALAGIGPSGGLFGLSEAKAAAEALAAAVETPAPVGGLFGQSVNLDTEPATSLTSNPATDPNNVGGLFGSGVAAAQAADEAQAAAEAVAAATEADAQVGALGALGAPDDTTEATTEATTAEADTAEADTAAADADAAAAAAAAAADADAAAASDAASDAAAGSEGEAGSDGDAGDGGDGGDGGGDGGDGGGGDGGGGDGGYARGGLVAFANGGLVPLANGGKIAIGPGGGLDDLIPTSINGRRAAALSDGEFVIPADVVSMMGDGSSNAGARRFYDLVKQVRQTKTGTSRQAGPLPVGDILKRSLAR